MAQEGKENSGFRGMENAAWIAAQVEVVSSDQTRRAMTVPEKHANIFYNELLKRAGEVVVKEGETGKAAMTALIQSFKERKISPSRLDAKVSLTGPQVETVYGLVRDYIPVTVTSNPYRRGDMEINAIHIFSSRLAEDLVISYPDSPPVSAGEEVKKKPYVSLRVPVFDYWREAVDKRFNLIQGAVSHDGSYEKALRFKESAVYSLHERFQEAAGQEGDRRKIYLSLKDASNMIDYAITPFNAGERAIHKEMVRELRSSIPRNNPINVLINKLRKK